MHVQTYVEKCAGTCSHISVCVPVHMSMHSHPVLLNKDKISSIFDSIPQILDSILPILESRSSFALDKDNIPIWIFFLRQEKKAQVCQTLEFPSPEISPELAKATPNATQRHAICGCHQVCQMLLDAILPFLWLHGQAHLRFSVEERKSRRRNRFPRRKYFRSENSFSFSLKFVPPSCQRSDSKKKRTFFYIALLAIFESHKLRFLPQIKFRA